MIRENLLKIQDRIDSAAKVNGRSKDDITLVAVSKRFPISALAEAFDVGQFNFGENYLQEVLEKRPQLNPQAKIHFIGHLQTNKAKLAADNCSIIETVDRVKLGKALNKHLISTTSVLNILVQVNIGGDSNKAGVAPEHAEKLIEDLHEFSQLRICGLMTMPPLSLTPEEARPHFRNLRKLSEKIQTRMLFHQKQPELSMGMSADFEVAIAEGATIIRVGTAIFGARAPR